MTKFQRFKRWLFWYLFPEEAETLKHYQLNTLDVEQWFIGHVPEVSTAAKWIRQISEPRLRGDEQFRGLSINRLRENLIEQRVKSLYQLQQEAGWLPESAKKTSLTFSMYRV